MQLIFETETTLDIETNMSSVEDKQNNKMECLDITGTDDKKYNVSEDIVDVDKDEIAEALVNIPIDNEAECSRPDLSDVICEQNSTEPAILQDDEIKNNDSIVTLSPGKEINHSDIIENQNEGKIEDISEEDYIEDDIISIREETFHESDSQKHFQTLLTKDDGSLLDETQYSEDDKMNIDDEVKETSNENANYLSTKDEKDDIELKEENVSTAPCEKETESLVIDETSVYSKTKAKEDKFLLAHSKMETEMHDLVETEDETPVKASVLSVDKLHSPVKESIQGKDKVNEIIEDNVFTVHSNSELAIEDDDMANKIQEISANSEVQLDTANEHEKELRNDATPTVVSVQCEQANFATSVDMISNECAKITSDVTQIIDSEGAHEESIITDKVDLVVIKEDDNTEVKESVREPETITKTANLSTELQYDTDEAMNKNISNEKDTNTNEKNSIIELEDNTEVESPLKELQHGMDDKEIIKITAKNTNTKDAEIKLKSSTEVQNTVTDLQHEIDVDEIVENSSTDINIKLNAKEDTLEVKGNTEADNISIELDHDMDVEEIVGNNLNNESSNAVEKISDLPVKENTEGDNALIELQNDMDVEEIVEKTSNNKEIVEDLNKSPSMNSSPVKNYKIPLTNNGNKDKPIICKLSNTLDIFSDEEEECSEKDPEVTKSQTIDTKEKQCINIDDDDDIMLIDEETNKVEENTQKETENNEVVPQELDTGNTDLETGEKVETENHNLLDKSNQKETTAPAPVIAVKDSKTEIDINEKSKENKNEKHKKLSPLIPDNFVKVAKTKFADMTREDLEEFCILKIVESIVDRSSLSDINNKLKEMTQGLEDYRKKAMMLAKQNRDLQVVLKSVQEEQKKANAGTPITPLKITRSVGVQVYMDKAMPRKKVPQQNVNNRNTTTPQNRNANPSVRTPCPPKPVNQNIPVPRLVPANNPSLKSPSNTPQINQTCAPNKNTNQLNGVIRNPSPALKADKRPHNKIASGETVDLTDDEPPAKMPGGPKSSVAPPVRVVPPQTLMAPQRQPFIPSVSSPRKVFIPISGQGNQTLRPGQTIMLKTIPTSGIRPRCPTPQRVDSNSMRLSRITARHPAPLPSGMKQYQPPNWKPLPPSPDLKLSKVENGLVISWKIEDVPEDSYEEIASYQLFAYQETSLPPNTALWKKIGDVKALPLPMACTLTQFMAGYKYYFAVRAVDIRSRLGPFSLPGSILLLNKNIID